MILEVFFRQMHVVECGCQTQTCTTFPLLHPCIHSHCPLQFQPLMDRPLLIPAASPPISNAFLPSVENSTHLFAMNLCQTCLFLSCPLAWLSSDFSCLGFPSHHPCGPFLCPAHLNTCFLDLALVLLPLPSSLNKPLCSGSPRAPALVEWPASRFQLPCASGQCVRLTSSETDLALSLPCLIELPSVLWLRYKTASPCEYSHSSEEQSAFPAALLCPPAVFPCLPSALTLILVPVNRSFKTLIHESVSLLGQYCTISLFNICD